MLAINLYIKRLIVGISFDIKFVRAIFLKISIRKRTMGSTSSIALAYLENSAMAGQPSCEDTMSHYIANDLPSCEIVGFMQDLEYCQRLSKIKNSLIIMGIRRGCTLSLIEWGIGPAQGLVY